MPLSKKKARHYLGRAFLYFLIVIDYKAAKALTNEKAEQKWREAETAFEKQQYKHTILLLSELYKNYPHNKSVKILLAKAYARNQEYKESYDLFKSLGIKKVAPDFAYELGVTFFYYGQCRKAQWAFKNIPEQSQDRATARSFLANCYAKLNKPSPKKRRKTKKRQETNFNTSKKIVDNKPYSYGDLSNFSSIEGGYESSSLKLLNDNQINSNSRYFLLDGDLKTPLIKNKQETYFLGGNFAAKRTTTDESYQFKSSLQEDTPSITTLAEELSLGLHLSIHRGPFIPRIGTEYSTLIIKSPEDPGINEQKFYLEWENKWQSLGAKFGLIHQKITPRPADEGDFKIPFASGLIKQSLETTVTQLGNTYTGDLYVSVTQSRTIKDLGNPGVVSDDELYGEIYQAAFNAKRHFKKNTLLLGFSLVRNVLHLTQTTKLGEESRPGLILEWSSEFNSNTFATLTLKKEALLGYRALVISQEDEEKILTVNGEEDKASLILIRNLWHYFDAEVSTTFTRNLWPSSQIPKDTFMRATFEEEAPRNSHTMGIALRLNIEF